MYAAYAAACASAYAYGTVFIYGPVLPTLLMLEAYWLETPSESYVSLGAFGFNGGADMAWPAAAPPPALLPPPAYALRKSRLS